MRAKLSNPAPGEKIADLVNKLAGPPAEEVGMMLGDTIRVYRVKNRIRTVEKRLERYGSPKTWFWRWLDGALATSSSETPLVEVRRMTPE